MLYQQGALSRINQQLNVVVCCPGSTSSCMWLYVVHDQPADKCGCVLSRINRQMNVAIVQDQPADKCGCVLSSINRQMNVAVVQDQPADKYGCLLSRINQQLNVVVCCPGSTCRWMWTLRHALWPCDHRWKH